MTEIELADPLLNSDSESLATFVRLAARNKGVAESNLRKRARQEKGRPDFEAINVAYDPLVDMARSLPSVNRISYDQAVLDFVKSTEEIEIEEITAHLMEHASFLFDNLWIEGPTPLDAKFHRAEAEINGKPYRLGALINANQDAKEFSFSYVIETRGSTEVSEVTRQTLSSLLFLREGRY